MPALVYRFAFADGVHVSVPVLSSEPGATVAPPVPAPAWTALGFHQCRNCPLQPDDSARCPMALQFVPLIAAFAHRNSFDPVTVEVEFDERTVRKDSTVQRAMGSLMGLLAAQSGCPRTAFLRPMARYHLPFASEEETLYRVASMYLLAQYLRQSQGGEPDWALAQLKAHYAELQKVNAAMAQRLRASHQEDGAVNAVTLLDLLAKALPYSINEALADLAPVFEAYRGL
ncbi:MAG: DUF6901 family protein [Rhodoferax sp.]